MLGQQIFLDHRSSRTIDQKLRYPTVPPVAAAPPLSFLSLPKNGHFFLLQHNGSPGRSQNDQAYLEVLAQAVEDRGCLDPPCCLEGEQIIYLENWARRQKLRKLPKLLTRIGDAQKKCFSCAHKLKAFLRSSKGWQLQSPWCARFLWIVSECFKIAYVCRPLSIDYISCVYVCYTSKDAMYTKIASGLNSPRTQ